MNSKQRWEDHYSRQAKKDRYPARSVYKLKEIQHKYRLINKGDKVLDLGCAPGSWLLYAASLTGASGRVVGIDLKPVSVSLPSYVQVHIGDVLSMDAEMFKKLGEDFNMVMSDMAPATTGRKDVDAARSFTLCCRALRIASFCLCTGGSFICKIFQGEDFMGFIHQVKSVFHRHKIIKPQSSRKASREVYVIGLNKKQEGVCQVTANGLPFDIKKAP
ncbi:MAG: RlmE family RNA methyltransferase [Deltaproteobacteria bacterium]|nr:RlmE family RNA methyltransferase [Deltaproteobacteria bacterium]MBW1994476.1 RlmE family RNA methyltransferase [Deltaproteobacteria bacterium]MBW2152396.1 RlmE family RNA methyltransferase [Deltaproteobacteria bacterium]